MVYRACSGLLVISAFFYSSISVRTAWCLLHYKNIDLNVKKLLGEVFFHENHNGLVPSGFLSRRIDLWKRIKKRKPHVAQFQHGPHNVYYVKIKAEIQLFSLLSVSFSLIEQSNVSVIKTALISPFLWSAQCQRLFFF